MSTSENGLIPQDIKSVTTGVTNAPQRLSVFNRCDVRSEEWQIADVQADLQEADRGEFASAEEVRGVYAKYGH